VRKTLGAALPSGPECAGVSAPYYVMGLTEKAKTWKATTGLNMVNCIKRRLNFKALRTVS